MTQYVHIPLEGDNTPTPRSIPKDDADLRVAQLQRRVDEQEQKIQDLQKNLRKLAARVDAMTTFINRNR